MKLLFAIILVLLFLPVLILGFFSGATFGFFAAGMLCSKSFMDWVKGGL